MTSRCTCLLSSARGIDGGQVWKGDVKKMKLSVDKLALTGWKPKYGSEQAVKLSAQALMK
jgi:UDP-glucose 4-epimerase